MYPEDTSEVETSPEETTEETLPESETQPLDEQDQPEEVEADAPDVTNETPTETQAIESQPEEVEDVIPQLPQIQMPVQPDINQFVDENGNLDLMAYNQAQAQAQQQVIQASVAQATAQIRAERQYEKDWNKAYDYWPELKSNKQLETIVKALHQDSATPGAKYKSPLTAAREIQTLMGGAKQQGVKAATERRTVQAAAALGVTNPPQRAQGDRTTQLKNTMRNGATLKDRQDANRMLLEDMVAKGLI